jgi:biopolymer transport protein ExbD
MRRSRRNALPDLTPLVDILFLLILFFVLTTTFLRQGLSVDLPTGEGESRENSLVRVLLTVEGDLYWDEEPLSEAELSGRLSREVPESVSLEADRRVPYGGVVRIFSLLRAAGVEHVLLVVEQGEE